MSIKYLLSVTCLVFVSTTIFAQKYSESNITLHTESGDLQGTLAVPHTSAKVPLAIIIQGSGPTDRNGNTPIGTNNSLKMLAQTLGDKKIASLRFDKRGIAQSKDAAKDESEMRFEDNAADVSLWIELLRKDERFGKITLIGHSEGSLVALLAAKHADAYISLAGAGRPIDIILKEQLDNIPEDMKAGAFTVIDSLKMGHMVNKYDPRLFSIFRPSVQPYMISWIKYDPAREISNLKLPALIIQGTKDLQVGIVDAKLLSQAKPNARYVLIQNMNHVLKDITSDDRNDNYKSYNDPVLPLDKTLVKEIQKFIKKYGK